MTNSAEIHNARRSDEIEASVACTFVRAAWVGVPVLVVDQAIKLVSRADVPLCTATAAECAQASPAGPLTTMSIGHAGGILRVVESVGLWGLIGVIALALLPFSAHHARPGSWTIPLAVGLQLAGALATVLDWLLIGGVTVPLLVNDAPLLIPADVALVAGAAFAGMDQLARLAARRGGWSPGNWISGRFGWGYGPSWRDLGRRWTQGLAG